MAETKQFRRDDGSIYRHPDGKRWFARLQYIDAKGRRTQKKRICITYEAAKRKLRELKDEIENDNSDRRSYRELDRFYRDRYLHKAKIVDGKKLSGFRQKLSIIEHYLDSALEYFGDMYIDSITHGDLREFKHRVADRPLKEYNPDNPTRQHRRRSVADINHHLRQVRRLMSIAVQNGWLSVNPFKLGDPLIIESHQVERTRILSADEEKILLAKCEPWRRHIKPIVIVAIETGMRRGELQSLRWSSVDFDGRYIRVEALNSKTLKPRLVPLSARAAETLGELWRCSTKNRSALVFGRSDFKKAFNNACGEAGLSDVRFHDLRHTAITRMLEKGISPPLVMKISGHSQQKTFLRYVNQSESSVLEIAKQLDRAA